MEWRRQRAVYERRDTADLDDLGFAAFFLNRTNRSGIIGCGVIGGQQQDGNWALDARFDKTELIERIRKIARFNSRIRLYQLDALEFTNTVIPRLGRRSFSFCDPPYIENGDDELYLHTHTTEDHLALARRIARLRSPWAVTYDEAALRQPMFTRQRRIVYWLHYTSQDRYEGKEVMYLSDDLEVPSLTNLLTRECAQFTLNAAFDSRPDCVTMASMKPAPEIPAPGSTPFENFDRLFRAVVAVPKSEVEKEEAKERLKNRRKRARKKAAKK